MAGELVAQLHPRKWDRVTSVGYTNAHNAVQLTDLVGLRLNKLTADYYSTVFQLPASLTYATGLTFYFLVTDNGENQGDPGLVLQLGLTVKKLASGDTPSFATAAGTEQTSNVTLQSTAGQFTLASFAVANANLDSAGAGDVVAVKLRRVSSAAADTMVGSATIIPVAVKNT
jgi:hypothetical protein